MRIIAAFAFVLAMATGAAAQSADGDRFTAAFAVEGQSLDPAKYTSGADTNSLGQIYEQLIRPDADGKMINWLAESWSVAGDAAKPIIDVHLHKGVKFHNGYPLTSADFEFSYRRMSDPKVSRWSHLHAAIERFEIVDDHHFRIHFKYPDANYVTQNLTLFAMSKKYFDEVGEDTFARQPIGTGPWKFISRKIGQEMQFERFDDYWNAPFKAKFKYFTIRVIPEETTRVAALKTGAVDWIDAVPLHEIPNFTKDPNYKVVSKSSAQHLFIIFNTHMANSPFKDIRVRQAVAHAIDMPTIIKTTIFGQGETYAVLAPEDIGYDPSLKPLAYDPARAKKLLAEAGFSRGIDVPCYNAASVSTIPNLKNVGDAIFAYLSASGIRCKPNILEYAAWINSARREVPPEMDGLQIMTWAYTAVPGDPNRDWMGRMHSLVPGTGFGAFSYNTDPELDEMIKGQNRIMDGAKRAEEIKRISRIMHERMSGGVPLYLPKATFAWKSSIDFTPLPWTWHEMLQVGPKK